MYSDDSDFDDDGEGGPIVVEVRGSGSRGSPVSARRSPASGRRSASARARRRGGRSHRDDEISE